MAHDQEIMGLNPGTLYWMDVSENNENKGSQMGQTQKKYLKNI
jgi:hypothetical protein